MAIVTIDQDQASFTGGDYGTSVHGVRFGALNFEDAPKKLLLIYMCFRPESGLDVVHLGADLGSDAVDDVVTGLIRQARSSVRPDVTGFNFDKLVFNEPTYVAFALDDKSWDFYRDPRLGAEHVGANIIVFRPEKTLADSAALSTYAENWAFSDLRSVATADCPTVVMINFHCKDKIGTPFNDDGETQRYCFDINLRLPFVQAGEKKHITLIIDPTGENQGPRPPGL